MIEFPAAARGNGPSPPSPDRPAVVVVAAGAMSVVAILATSGGLLWVAGCLVLAFALTMFGTPVWPWLLLPVGLGLAVLAAGLLSGYLARGLLAGKRGARRASLAVAMFLGLLALAQTWGLTRAGTTNWVWPALAAVSGIVVVGLIRAGRWFDPATDVRAASMTAGSSGAASFLGVVIGAVAVVAIVSLSPQIAGDARPLGYLHGLAEQDLRFPEAELTTTRETGQDARFGFGGPATIERRFEVEAAVPDVVAWYDSELTARGWVRDDRSQASWDDPRIPRWRRGFATIEVRGEDASGGGSVVWVVTVAERFGYDYATLDALKELPASRLAYPGSVARSSGEMPRRTSDTIVFPAYFNREFETDAEIAELSRFVDTELRSQGWARLVPDQDDIGTSWVKDGYRVRLTAHDLEPPSGTAVIKYRVSITEVLDDTVTPGLPWG